MTLNEMMNRFRVAGRELFNHFFHASTVIHELGVPLNVYSNEAWDFEERFSHVEEALFENLVCVPAKLTHVAYGSLQPEILVELRGDLCSIMLNREIKSGYWDFPLSEVTRDARLFFIKFFDWDLVGYRDNQYVRVQVADWPSHREAVGKEAMIESRYVHFVLAASLTHQTTD